MYSTNHFIWLGIVTAVITVSLIWLKRNKPPLKKVLSVCCFCCILSELTKVFSTIAMVPSADGTQMYLYLELDNLPLHLCSIQIINIFYCRFAKDSKFKEALLAFMYASCSLGAAMALLIPTILSDSSDVQQAFLNPHSYEYFLYHAMLIILGVYIYMSGEVDLRPKHYLTSLGFLGVMAFLSLYLNSMFASATYVNGELVSVDFVPNFFFTVDTPIDIPLTEMWHWYVYLLIILTLALSLIALFYIPVFRKAAKLKKQKTVC